MRSSVRDSDDDADLEVCAAEPIHVPGSVQPRGVLMVLDADVVVQVSANAEDLLGVAADDVLGRTVAAVLGDDAAAALRLDDVADGGPLADGLRRVVLHGRTWVASTHRNPQSAVIVELEPLADQSADPAEPYRAAYTVLGQAATAGSLEELYALTARGVREVTGFDRVMVYRFDEDHHGEVVGESRREDLEPLLGHRYPAGDIPPQARALYEKSWLRLISDVESVPRHLVPVLLPGTGEPTDLSFASLRAVSPVHVEYLRNMGVAASMSISLLRGGRLWGMVACHHVDGPHTPSLEVRAAAEALASGLSLQMVVREAADDAQHARDVSRALEALVRAEDDPVAHAVAQPELLRILGVDGAVVRTGDVTAAVGLVPDAPEVVVDVVRRTATPRKDVGTEPVYTSDDLRGEHPELKEQLGEVAGALVAPLPDGDLLALFRREVAREVTWGGDPSAKTVDRDEDGTVVRVGPRRSFAAWREAVHGTCEPWSDHDVRAALVARRTVVELLYRRSRPDLGAALVLQHSSLPAALPTVPGWRLEARYRPADGGRVGGDWYDAFELPDGRTALVIGDVAGHGLPAASAMNQLRNGLRSLLLEHRDVATAAAGLDRLARTLLTDDMATLLVGILEVDTDTGAGVVDYVCAGHLPPVVADAHGARWVEVVRNPPVGAMRETVRAGQVTLVPGESLLLYTDGLVERRGTRLRDRLEDLRSTLGLTCDLEVVEHKLAGLESDDDSTMLLVTALPRP
ncbi:SpoIIE family protein phosphatase [Krasilnikoviella flava]|uniref:Bacteriophytochrome (Light-regulated signal transduction histidine kinase) n=1 Tax=Krasilnikoviella flava TaxID=526729 RepID=A0A1T5K383_9MICO|nr:SpoIIE family protein phosphatase [Krasilnikoviella flava]SKC57938.1 Bacteriophytochrome (light-regulated signal transduction histidine kinase) [Krasilnikoviella flava]